MSSESPKDTDSVESLKDSALDTYKKKLIEDTEKLVALVLGILQELGPNYLIFYFFKYNILLFFQCIKLLHFDNDEKSRCTYLLKNNNL
jgi:hypothetical protein